MQVTIHPLPKFKYNIGYYPKGPVPDETQIEVLKQIGLENNCLFVKWEPNMTARANNETEIKILEKSDQWLWEQGCKPGRPLFTKYSFIVDINKTEKELISKMHPKTRYNIRLAERKGVKVTIDNSEVSFKWFLSLLFDKTVTRQGFYAHTPEYYKQLWSVLQPAGMAHLIRASFKDKTLSVLMAFVHGDKIYYPYGASTREYKELMAPNLAMWELIKFGKEKSCKTLDMWGALGPKPNPNDPWYGFHRFKAGYGGELAEFLGSYDLILNNKIYPVFRMAEKTRWAALGLQTGLRKMPHTILGTGVKTGDNLKKMGKLINSLFE